MPLDERGGKQASKGYLQSPSKIHQQQKNTCRATRSRQTHLLNCAFCKYCIPKKQQLTSAIPSAISQSK